MKFYLLLLAIIFCNIINAEPIDIIQLHELIDQADSISYAGPKLHCRLKEVGREFIEGGFIERDFTVHSYSFEIENLKSDPKTYYSLEIIDSFGTSFLSIQLKSIENDQFLIHFQDETALLKDFIIQFVGMSPGVPIYFALMNEKEEILCATYVIPVPYEAETVDAKKVCLKLISRESKNNVNQTNKLFLNPKNF